jgi:hypothetical protein
MTFSLVFSRSGESPSGRSPGRWELWCVNANADTRKVVHRGTGPDDRLVAGEYVILLRSDFATWPSNPQQWIVKASGKPRSPTAPAGVCVGKMYTEEIVVGPALLRPRSLPRLKPTFYPRNAVTHSALLGKNKHQANSDGMFALYCAAMSRNACPAEKIPATMLAKAEVAPAPSTSS